jgi:hypothetical protein
VEIGQGDLIGTSSPVNYINPESDDHLRMNRPVSALDFCVYLKRCEVQCSIFEDMSREIDLYQPDYYTYWARLKVQICAYLDSR